MALTFTRGAAQSFDLQFFDFTTGQPLSAAPTIASGDIQISKDGGSFANITNTPTAIGTTGWATISLTAAEMTCDRFAIRLVDAAGNEWRAMSVTGRTIPADFSAHIEAAYDGTGYAGGTIRQQVDARQYWDNDDGNYKNFPDGMFNWQTPLNISTFVSYVALIVRDDAAIFSDLAADVANINTNYGSGAGSYGASKSQGKIASDAAAIKAKTDNLPSDPADQSLIIAATNAIVSDVAAVKSDTAAILLDTGTDGVALSAATNNAIADAILKRDVDQVESTAPADSLCGVVLAAFHAERTGPTTMVVYRTDDSTTFKSKTIATDAALEPVEKVSG